MKARRASFPPRRLLVCTQTRECGTQLSALSWSSESSTATATAANGERKMMDDELDDYEFSTNLLVLAPNRVSAVSAPVVSRLETPTSPPQRCKDPSFAHSNGSCVEAHA